MSDTTSKAVQSGSTIYVVTDGEYDDYTIRAVFSTKEMADRFSYALRGSRIEEYTLDGEPVPLEPTPSWWRRRRG